jgi:hypothetical protein
MRAIQGRITVALQPEPTPGRITENYPKDVTMKPVFPSLLVCAMLLGAGLAAQAQSAPPVAADHPAMHHRMGHMDPARMEAMVTKHLAELKTKLKITPAQEGSWNAFTAAMKPPAQPMAHPDRAELDKLTTPERIDKMHALRSQHMADMQANMDKRDNAIKALYASLNDEQKKVMDVEHARMGKAMDHMREGHRGNDKNPGPIPPGRPATDTKQ